MDQSKIIVHEIGHYVQGHLNVVQFGCFRDSSLSFWQDHSLKAQLENEANLFAADFLLDTDETIEAIHAYDITTVARILHVPVEFLDYKLQLLYRTGILEHYHDFFQIQSDCLRRIESNGLIANSAKDEYERYPYQKTYSQDFCDCSSHQPNILLTSMIDSHVRHRSESGMKNRMSPSNISTVNVAFYFQ